jgi:hypothetical protein
LLPPPLMLSPAVPRRHYCRCLRHYCATPLRHAATPIYYAPMPLPMPRIIYFDAAAILFSFMPPFSLAFAMRAAITRHAAAFDGFHYSFDFIAMLMPCHAWLPRLAASFRHAADADAITPRRPPFSCRY